MAEGDVCAELAEHGFPPEAAQQHKPSGIVNVSTATVVARWLAAAADAHQQSADDEDKKLLFPIKLMVPQKCAEGRGDRPPRSTRQQWWRQRSATSWAGSAFSSRLANGPQQTLLICCRRWVRGQQADSEALLSRDSLRHYPSIC